MRARPIVTLLTDFGTQDPFVGIMKGIILDLCPEANLVDLCHEVRPFDIRGASFLLQDQRWSSEPEKMVTLHDWPRPLRKAFLLSREERTPSRDAATSKI